ncbi:MAG TPA: hypothetical protein VEB21_07540 [Terriglobales bacterium]|nr:hypothetical protein [Terriglobales bacterium]
MTFGRRLLFAPLLMLILFPSVALAAQGSENCFGPVFTTSFADSDTTTGRFDHTIPQTVKTCGAGSPQAGSGHGEDLMYLFNTAEIAAVSVTLTPTDSESPDNLSLYVVRASCPTGFVSNDCIIGSDAGGAGASESVTFTAAAGEDYFLVVDGTSGDDGPFDLAVDVIILPPVDHLVGYKTKVPRLDFSGGAIEENRFPQDWVVTLDDVHLHDAADDPENFVVRNAASLLVPARKNAEPGPAHPERKYLRYEVKPGRESVAPAGADGNFAKPVRHISRIWRLENQFGTVEVLSKKLTSMLVPAEVSFAAAPAVPGDATHFACYAVRVTRSVSAQTPETQPGAGQGKFRKDLQAFFGEVLFDDCERLADDSAPSFAATPVQGTCLLSIAKPAELCNPVDKTAVEPPRTTSAVIDTSLAATTTSLLCYDVKLAGAFTASDAAGIAGRQVGELLSPRQVKHVRRSEKSGSAILIRPGNQFPGPIKLDSNKLESICVPTEVVGVAVAP